MAVPIYVVDAFAEKPFHGNHAAICLLEERRAADWMQSVAAEMNLSETAFITPLETGYELRWFAPEIEVDLCGHATLASAHVLWKERLIPTQQPICFQTRSGPLTCRRAEDLIEMDFPSTPAAASEPHPLLLDALGVQPVFCGKSRFDTLVVVESEEIVRSLKPDFRKLRNVFGSRGIIVSSGSSDPRFDFVSRFFAPIAGIEEDPVTGSAHCCLGPFWSVRLGKSKMTAFQASRRGGIVHVRLVADRVILGGKAVTVTRGELLA
jgi:PhzF family phenazine biosynthesis protein